MHITKIEQKDVCKFSQNIEHYEQYQLKKWKSFFILYSFIGMKTKSYLPGANGFLKCNISVNAK